MTRVMDLRSMGTLFGRVHLGYRFHFQPFLFYKGFNKILIRSIINIL